MVTIVNILKENNQPNKKPDANCRTGGTGEAGSDEPEPSWLELKDFQLGSARLVTFFTLARN